MISLREFILQDLAPRLPLYEQAMNRDKFLDKVDDIMPTLLSHWGLIEYAHGDFEENDSYEIYVEHWKRELKGFCKKIVDYKIKGGNKEKALQYICINTLELNDWELVYDMIRDKFEDENISLFDCKVIAKYLSQHINKLIKILCDSFNYRNWIEEL